MRKTTKFAEGTKKLTTDIIGLMELTGLGRTSSEKIGREAGAVLHVGRRCLYHVPKIEKYLEELTEAE